MPVSWYPHHIHPCARQAGVSRLFVRMCQPLSMVACPLQAAKRQ